MLRVIGWLLGRTWRIGLAWFVGFVIYMVATVLDGTIYDGFPGMFVGFICQPPMGIVISGFFVFAALVVGSPLTLSRRWSVWRPALFLNLAIMVAAIALMIFSQPLGLTAELVNPITNHHFIGPDPVAIIAGFFLFIFSIVNWPSLSF